MLFFLLVSFWIFFKCINVQIASFNIYHCDINVPGDDFKQMHY